MEPILIAALPSILDSMFNAIEYVSKRTNGTLDEAFIESRTIVRQALAARAESLTAPQDGPRFTTQTAELRIPNTGGTMTNPDSGRVANTPTGG